MASSQEEPMEVDNNEPKLPLSKPANDVDVAELKVSLSSPEWIEPQKFKRDITRTLQSWANKNKINGEFTATKISDDGKTAVISVTPAAALSELQKLSGEVLATKEHKKFSMRPFTQAEQNQDDKKSSEEYSSLTVPNAHNEPVDLNNKDSSADDGSEKPCLVALGPYWYMKNIYPEQIQRIEEDNGVKITENVAVNIKADKKHGNPEKASDEFIKLVQSCLSESGGVSIPLKKVGPDEWKDTLKFLQTTDHKCQITVSSDQITVFGPPQIQTAISKSLQRTKSSTNYTDEERMEEQDKGRRIHTNSFNGDWKTPDRDRISISSTIKDPLVNDGLTFEDHGWEIITHQYKKEVDRIKDKFNVGFKVSGTTKGKIIVTVRYNKSDRNMSMESHAIRALLRLYQKALTPQLRSTNGSFDDEQQDMYRGSDELKGAYAKTSMDRQAETKGSTEEGAAKEPGGAGAKKDEKEEETCPICMDTFTKKTQLKCKHEFCKDCLDQAVKTSGSMCPVCKDVFGLVEGDQPPGTMTWSKTYGSLPGYERCGIIQINYDIPSGTQTKKHPNPGQRYQGLNRSAYLPDNREGNEVLHLLKRAFDQKLTFTVGTSRTTGAQNVVTWNDIHHKTNTSGGPQSFGYPDPDYLSRVKDELKAKGIK